MSTEPRTLRPAIWLVERFVPMADAVVGDILEQFRRGRSAWWVWQQALGALAAAGWSDLRAHPIVVTRAVLVTSVAFVVVLNASGRVFGSRAFTTWELHGLNACWCAVATWAGARSHRRALAGTALVVFGLLLVGQFTPTLRLVADSLDHARFRPYLVDHLVRVTVAVCGSGLGLLLASQRPSMGAPHVRRQ